MCGLNCLEYFGDGVTRDGGRVLFSITSKGELPAYTQGHMALCKRCKQYSVISDPTRCYGSVGVVIF